MAWGEVSIAALGAWLMIAWSERSPAQVPAPSPTPAPTASGATFAHAHTRSGFLARVARSAESEIQMGGLAGTHAQNPDVKAFAQTLVSDSSRMQSEIKALAADKGRASAADTSRSSDGSLAAKSGTAFDSAYLDAVAHDQGSLRKVLESETQSSDADLAEFAKREMQTVRQHEEQARRLAGKSAG